MRSYVFGLILAIAACSSANTAGGAGNFTGTLYFPDEGGFVNKVDLATGAYTHLGAGSYPMKTKQGTILCTIDNNLADAPETMLTYRHIDDIRNTQGGATHDDIFGDGFSFPRQSPDGTKVAYLSNGLTLVVVDFQSGAKLAVINVTDAHVDDVLGFSRPSWTPDGRIVVGTELGNAGIYMTDTQFSTNFTRIDKTPLSDVTRPIVSHDGKFIAYVHAKHVWRMGIDASNPVQIDTNPNDTEVDDKEPFWSPDDQTIYWGGYAGDVYFHSAADGNGLAAQLFTFLPSLKDHVLIVAAPVAMDWVK